MKIMLNGEDCDVPEGHTVAALVAGLDLGQKRIAVEINEDIIPRSTYHSHVLATGDKVEVVTAIGGG